MTWQKWARLVIAVGGVAFAIVVAFGFRNGTAMRGGRVAGNDPKAVMETSKGIHERTTHSHEDLNIAFEHLTSYADGSSKLDAIAVTTTRANGREFKITAKEARVAGGESEFVFTGDVRVAVSDGMLIHTERATYVEKTGLVNAPGPVDIARGRMTGSAIGMNYDKTLDVVSLLDHVQLHMASDAHGAGAMEIQSPSAVFNRVDKTVRFDNGLKSSRGRQRIEADVALAHLSDDENHLETIDLHGNARISGAEGGVGGLRGLSGQNIGLKYGPDGEAIQHATVTGTAFIQLASEQGHSGRQIGANFIEVSLAPDGSTPTGLTASDGVELVFPAEAGVPARTISAQHLVTRGDDKHGLTSAHFEGNVGFREKGGNVDRQAKSQVLDAALGPGMSSLDEARFTRKVRFEDPSMAATAAAARYVLDKGTLELSGNDEAGTPPHMDTERMAIGAPKISITLDGPVVSAAGPVKSVLKRESADGAKNGRSETKMPSMLKKDQDVFVTAGSLDYDGNESKAVYKDDVKLSQGDTSIKALSMVIDDKTGDLVAAGAAESPVVTTMVQEEPGKDQKPQRLHSTAKATDLKYDDDSRRLEYTGAVHMNGPAGDVTAERIEMFLKPAGDEIDRLEGYTKVTLKETSGRTTTGSRLTYTSAGDRYVVVGTPARVVEACGRDTTGNSLTLYKANDRIEITGTAGVRAETAGTGSNCGP
jgi:lipopolysaccharide export system protein LptA